LQKAAKKMIASGHAQVVELLDRAFNEGDPGTALSFYDDETVVVMEPGKLARGTEELRSFFGHAMQSGFFGRAVCHANASGPGAASRA
jgi:ketosteroid isomerase-like protein